MTDTAKDYLSLAQVSVRRGDRQVLHDLSVELGERRVGLVGANGSGKSTLLRLTNGLITADEGQITVYGMDPKKDPGPVRKVVGFVFQDPEAQIVMPTVAEEVAFGLKPLKLSKEEVEARRADALTRFGLAGRDTDSAHLLSGGEKQRLALASIFAMRPEILIMDEPTAMLDLPGRRHFQRMVRDLPQPVVIATHDLDLLQDFDRVLVLDEGRIVHDGPPADSIPAYEALVKHREDAL